MHYMKFNKLYDFNKQHKLMISNKINNSIVVLSDLVVDFVY